SPVPATFRFSPRQFGAFSSTTVRGNYAPTGDTVIQQYATVNFLQDVTLPRLTLQGVLTGPSTVTITGLLSLVGGTMSGTGRTVAAGGIVADSFATLAGRTLDNAATATWRAPQFGLSGGARLDNTP